MAKPSFFSRAASDRAGERSKIQAIMRSQAVIEFGLDGTILRANDNFLKTMGYDEAEIVGRHHRMFVEPATAQSAAYQQFWQALGRGEYQSREFLRLAKNGRPVGVIKFATDITARKLHAADDAGKIAAISRSQAMIEFELDGTIITANENFLTAMGYRLEEVVGRHHRMFVEPATAQSADYAQFWHRLAHGDVFAAEFKRLAKAMRSGSRAPTTRSSIATASRSR